MNASTGITTYRTFKNAGRLKTILGVFARHGFENFVEKAKLGRFVLEKISKVDLDKYTMEERLRMSFEELGPTFIKLGQLLATRPDLIPQNFCDEFKKLHDNVQTVPFSQMREVIEEHFDNDIEEVFASFDPDPIGAASIAQVYKATLRTGERVVVKVQRPGIVDVIYKDLNVLYALAELIDNYIPESRIYNPTGVVDEFFKSLELETNFIVEANNIARFQKNFQKWKDVKIPEVYLSHSGRSVLVMEQLFGMPFSNPKALDQKNIDRRKLIDVGIRCYFKMVFKDGFFHGDMHPGNLFALSDGRLGLIDFGQVGRLNPRTRAAISNMLVALATEDYDRFAYEYIDLAPFSEHVDVDVLSRQIRDLLSPYYGLTIGDVNTGQLLLQTTSVAVKNKLQIPTELVLFFKSIVNIEVLGKQIDKDFDALEYALDFSKEMFASKVDPGSIFKDFSNLTRETNSLLASLPRHIKQILRRWNSPDHSIRMSIPEVQDLRKSMNHSSSLLFLGIVIGCLILSSSILVVADGSAETIPTISIIGYTISVLLSFIAVIDYIKR